MAPSESKAAPSRLIDREPAFVLMVLAMLAGIALIVWLAFGDVTVVFGVLGTLGVVFAAVQFVDARKTIESVKVVGGELADQLSTRQIGVFPEFVPKIADLLESAKESIVVFCDFPAYGELSAPDAFKRYARVIEEKGDKVNLLCLAEGPRRKLAREQMGKCAWEDYRSLKGDLIREYLNARELPFDYRTIKREDFVGVLAAGDTRMLSHQFRAAHQETTTLVMPLYFWIVDGEEAVFALAPFMEDALEVGFRTSDRELIRALKGIFERYRDMDEMDV